MKRKASQIRKQTFIFGFGPYLSAECDEWALCCCNCSVPLCFAKDQLPYLERSRMCSCTEQHVSVHTVVKDARNNHENCLSVFNCGQSLQGKGIQDSPFISADFSAFSVHGWEIPPQKQLTVFTIRSESL